jgi:hypothetical protein
MIKKLFISFIIGTILSLILITITNNQVWGHGFKPLIPYIGAACLGGICVACLRDDDERIFKLEEKIKELENKINND